MAPPTLLTIPPEMRNRIYREVLVEGRITISGHDQLPTEPPLLRVCRTTRHEALSIYYQENRFRFLIVDNDASKYIKWFKSCIRREDANISIDPYDSRNRGNLLKWAEAFYRGECGMPGEPEDAQTEGDAVEGILSVVERLQRYGVPWETVRAGLGDMRKALVAENQEWARETAD